MRIAGLVELAAQDLAAARLRSLISALGIGLGVGVLLIVAGLGLGARDVVLQEVVRQLPVDTIEVIPRTLDLGLFKTDSLFGGTELNAETLEKLRALEEVAEAYPKLEIALPLGARGGSRLFGRRLYTDLFMEGLPTELIDNEDFRDNPEFVPVVVSDQLLEIYNASVAPSVGTPKLSDESLTGFEFEIVVGRSLMLGRRGARTEGVERGRVVGVSRFAMRLGASVPLETARRLVKTYGLPGAEERYTSILLQAVSAKDVPSITASVEAMGLAVDETAKSTADLLNAATALASLIGLLVLALAALNIAHSFFASLSERRRELAVLRAVGARRIDLVVLVQAQALMLGVAGGLIGIVTARLLGLSIDALAATLLPDFPFKPASFFVFPLGLDALGFGAAVLAACSGALLPSLRAARESVAKVLAEG